MNGPVTTAPSTFVTNLAWILIAFGGLGVFGALMQNVLINFVMPSFDELVPPSQPAREAFPMLPFRIMGLLMLGVTGFVTYAAYALLRRRNWARRTFIILFALGIGFNVLWIVAFGLGFGLSEFPEPPDFPAQMRMAFRVMIVMFALFALGMSVLLAWLIKRLRSPVIKTEFVGAGVVT